MLFRLFLDVLEELPLVNLLSSYFSADQGFDVTICLRDLWFKGFQGFVVPWLALPHSSPDYQRMVVYSQVHIPRIFPPPVFGRYEQFGGHVFTIDPGHARPL